MKKTAIIGSSPNPGRYAYLAAEMLKGKGHEFFPVGIKIGKVLGKEILDIRGKPSIPDIDTVTLYINPRHQKEWYDYILSLRPKRIIFNPGTENRELDELAKAKGISTEFACTLVLLSTGQY